MSENSSNNNENKKTIDKGSSSSVSSNSKPPKHPDAKGYNPNLRRLTQNPKQRINKELAKKGIVTAVNAMTYGRGGSFAKGYLETAEGEEILDYAAEQGNNPKEVAEIAAKEIVKKQTFRATIIGIVSVLFSLIIIIAPIVVIFSKNPDLGMGGSQDDNNVFIELKEKISEVKSKYRSKYGVSIDENLILATLVAYQESETYTEDSQNETETITEMSETGVETIREVSVMTSKIEYLAKYQIITVKDGTCNSDSIRQIASNDDDNAIGVLKSPKDKEKNYKCVPGTEVESYELSVERGDPSDDNSGGVYYWNLIDGEFITDYYGDYIPESNDNSTNEKRQKAINKIVEDIYDYYETLEKENQMCNVVYVNCPGIKLQGESETLDLETYVAGVLKAEMGANRDIPETMKASAVAMRTFAIKQSDNCTKELLNSTANQVHSTIDPNNEIDQKYIEFTQETAGQVLTRNNELILAQYSTSPPTRTVSNGVCSYRLQRIGGDDSTWHTYKIPLVEEQKAAAKNGGFLVGHNWGMSQYGSIYEGSKGTPYTEILKIFYGEDTELSTLETASGMNSGCAADEGGLSVADASGFRARTAMPANDNQFYFSNLNASYAGGYTGQCTWYAFGRANETLSGAGSNLKWRHAPNAGLWYDFNLADGPKGFKSTRDPYKPKVGAIIVWKQTGRPGHVAFVEKVNSDGTIDYSEANVSSVKSASNPYGWRYNSNVPLEQIKTMWAGSGYSFVGYIYMIE